MKPTRMHCARVVMDLLILRIAAHALGSGICRCHAIPHPCGQVLWFQSSLSKAKCKNLRSRPATACKSAGTIVWPKVSGVGPSLPAGDTRRTRFPTLAAARKQCTADICRCRSCQDIRFVFRPSFGQAELNPPSVAMQRERRPSKYRRTLRD